MSHHSHHVPFSVIDGAALGLFVGHEISAQQKATGQSYGKAAAPVLGGVLVGFLVGPVVLGLAAWGLFMHPLVTIPSLFALGWLIWWLRQPATHQPGDTAPSPAPVPVLEDYPVTIAAHAPPFTNRIQRYPARVNVAKRL